MTIENPYDSAGTEPDLGELLADPVIHAVMRRDGVTLGDLCAVIRTGRDRLETPSAPAGWRRSARHCPDEARWA
jgi:hypothetical protein